MSRLGDIYKGEQRVACKVSTGFPVKGIVSTLLSFCLVCVAVLLLITLSIEGSVSVSKRDIGLGADFSVRADLPIDNVSTHFFRVVDNVLPEKASYPTTSTSSTLTSSTSTSTLKGWVYYPRAGTKPSGNNPGACGGGLGR